MVYDPTKPSFLIPQDISIDITISKTQASVTSAGNTYNQATLTYNQANTQYEGVTNSTQDVLPLSLSFTPVTPHIAPFGGLDIYTPNTYHSIGPGFFMFVTIR